MSGTRELVDAVSARLRPLEIEANQSWWLSSTQVSEAHDRRRVAADLALRDALGDPHAFAEVHDARAAGADTDPVVTRQLDVLHDAMVPQQVPADLRAEMVELETAVDSTFNSFRGTIDGHAVNDNAILKVLRASTDSRERQAAWNASKQVGAEVAAHVRELARLRNRAAVHLGYRDHFALALATSELSEQRLLATLDAVDRATAAPFGDWKAELDTSLAERFGLDVAALRPWHYDDPFFQDVPVAAAVSLDDELADADLDALTLRTYDGLGLDVRAVLERSDLLPRDGKSQHAFCIDIDHEGDVRVLCNNEPSERWAETMLHEFGHAIYDVEVSHDLPWSLRTMHPLTTEGVAMMFGRCTRDPRWLTDVAGIPADTVAQLAPSLAAARRAALLVFARWVLVMTGFERALYADPERDLDTLWWDLVERYQQVRRPDSRTAPDWAAKLHLALAPVYYQNYLYGELVASQLQATLHDRAGGVVDAPAAGALLRSQLFAPGASLRWDRLVERVTGEPLDPRHLARELEAV